MRRALTNDSLTDDSLFAAALGASGAAFLTAAALSGGLALEHMRQAAAICGSGTLGHCVWCGSTVALALGGLASLATARRSWVQQRDVAMQGGAPSARRVAGSAAASART